MDKVRILVIEDEAIIAMDIAKTLKNRDMMLLIPYPQDREMNGTELYQWLQEKHSVLM